MKAIALSIVILACAIVATGGMFVQILDRNYIGNAAVAVGVLLGALAIYRLGIQLGRND